MFPACSIFAYKTIVIWQKFWNWSWDELVAHDLPAVFNYVYGQTRQKINYVGHSLVIFLIKEM